MSPKTVLILGAGASRDLVFLAEPLRQSHLKKGGRAFGRAYRSLGPLSEGFFYAMARFNRLAKKHSPVYVDDLPSAELLEYVSRFYSEKTGVKIRPAEFLTHPEKSKKINIEELFVRLNQEIEKVEGVETDEATLRFNELYFLYIELERYVHQALASLSKYGFSIYHHILARYALEKRIPVVSFNWDILFEDRLDDLSGWDMRTGYGVRFEKIFDLDAEEVAPHEAAPSRILVLKPHSSINWFEKANNEYKNRLNLCLQDDVTRRFQTPRTLVDYLEHAETPYRNVIIPPSEKSSSIVSDIVSEFEGIWDRVKAEFEAAERLVVIGFSFNIFDEYVLRRLKDIRFRKGVEIVTVDPRAAAVRKRIAAFIPEARFTAPHKSFKHYCRWISRQKGFEDCRKFLS